MFAQLSRGCGVAGRHPHGRYFSSSAQTCDVAIIGSGVMGLNTAYQIARRSPSTKIQIIEKSAGPGYGSSGASSAICRTFYSLENQVQFTLDGMNLYRNWSDYLQSSTATAEYTKTGILIMIPMTKQEAEQHYAKYCKFGIRTSIMDKHTMQARFPQINADIGWFDNTGEKEFVSKPMGDDDYFFYEEDSGYFEPVASMNDLRNVLKERYSNTVEMHYSSKVEKVLHSGGRVKGLQLANKDNTQREITCGTVINCSGPWYNKVIQELNLDIELTLTPVRIQVIYKDCPELYTQDALNALQHGREHGVPVPAVSDAFSGIYFRPQKKSKQILASTTVEEEERDSWDPDVDLPNGADPEMRNKYLNSLYHRLEPILKPTSAKCQSLNGMYTVCEQDVHYIIGETKLKGFIVCNGFSGHGFKTAPAVGSMIAQYLTNVKMEGDTHVPIEFYSPYREPYYVKVKNVLA